MSLFDDALEIDDHVLAILACHLDFALIGKIAETASPNYRLTDSISLVAWDFLRTLPLDRAININLAARFLAHFVNRENNCGVIVIFLFQRRLDIVG